MVPPSEKYLNQDQPNVLWKFNVVAQTVCMVIAGILFFLRCYVRLGYGPMPKQWIMEDWMVCLSFVGLLIYSALMGVMMNHNAGVHEWNLTPEQASRALYYFWIETILYGPFIFCTKLSILLIYLRFFVPRRWSPLWTTIQIFIGISAAFYTALTLVKIFQCTPMKRAFDKRIPGKCISVPTLLIVSGLFNTISDALILLVPIKACWNLKMSWRKKVGVCAVFTIGAVAPIFSAIGFTCRIRAAPSGDTTYNNPLILLWATSEVTTGVVCACLPALPSLLRSPRQNASMATVSQSHSNPPEGSSHSYPQNKALSYGTYIELDETQIPTQNEEKVVTTVRGGPSPSDRVAGVDGMLTGNGSDARKRGSLGFGLAEGQMGIVRTVRIEQSGGL